MRELIIDCSGFNDEADFWTAYLSTTQPEGAQFFGRNFDALWDALNAGGPGWPGECVLRFANTDVLRHWQDGKFYRALQKIALNSKAIAIHMD
jgi:hypothetical protein